MQAGTWVKGHLKQMYCTCTEGTEVSVITDKVMNQVGCFADDKKWSNFEKYLPSSDVHVNHVPNNPTVYVYVSWMLETNGEGSAFVQSSK